MTHDVYRKLGELRVVPVIAIDDAAKAVELADALVDGGLPVAEITFRTDAGREAIRQIATARPRCLLGAGTILSVDQLKQACDAGATFGVSPGLNPKVVEAAVDLGFPFAPGVMTPSDIELGLDMGLSVLKFFPAEASGGVKMLKALSGPYAHTGLKFVPTGGIGASNFRDYLALGIVAAVGGSWVASRADIATGDWDAVRAHCRSVRAALEV